MNSDRALLLASLIAVAGCSAADIDWSKIMVCSNDAGTCGGTGNAGSGGDESGAGGSDEPPHKESSVQSGGAGGSPQLNGDKSRNFAGASGTDQDAAGGVGGTSTPHTPTAGAAGADAPKMRSAGGSAAPKAPSCGDGHVDMGELCDGNCMSDCPAPATSNACVHSMLIGSPDHCDVQCMTEPITTCISGDGCCPSTCTHASDTDCSAKCGDGVVDPGEKCEANSTTRPCPTSCDDGKSCTTDMLVGSANSCSAECANIPITAAHGGDGCCPPNANANNDSDCESKCGNNVREPGEMCDGDDCPTACSSSDACHPSSLDGSAGTCDAKCISSAITKPLPGDGCCPDGANAVTDSDCKAACGNKLLEPGEECEIGAQSDGRDGLAAGTIYDSWNCDTSCHRRRVLTPCSGGCEPNAAYCDPSSSTAVCGVKCTFDSAFANAPSPPTRHNCTFSNGKFGLCVGPDSCIPVCDTDADCPTGKPCVMVGTARLCN